MLIRLTLVDDCDVIVNSDKIILASLERYDQPVTCVEIDGAKQEIYVKETPMQILDLQRVADDNR